MALQMEHMVTFWLSFLFDFCHLVIHPQKAKLEFTELRKKKERKKVAGTIARFSVHAFYAIPLSIFFPASLLAPIFSMCVCV